MVKVLFSGGNKLKVFLIALFFLVITQSCFQNKENKLPLIDSENLVDSKNKDSIIINTIKNFYVSYISEKSKDIVHEDQINKILDNYVTKKLLNEIDKQELDYNPFVKAQDYSMDWLKTIQIKKDESKVNMYMVSFFNGLDNTIIYLGVVKDSNKYKIDKIETEIVGQRDVNSKELCSYENLIKNITIRVEKYSKDDSQNVKIIIVDFTTDKILQEIDYEPYNFNFNCKSSFYKNTINIHNENEIIVGDFNFDSLLDFAILYDSTINTGAVYTYFFQNKDGLFKVNNMFPINFIPSKIDEFNRTIEQVNIIGCCKVNTTVFQLKDNKVWEKISFKQENIQN